MNWLLGFKPAQIQVIKWILKLCLDRVIKFHRIWKTMKLNHSSSMSTFVKPTVWIIIHEIQFWKSVSYLLCLQICHDHNIAFTLRTYPHTDRNTIDDPHVATENIIENDMKFISHRKDHLYSHFVWSILGETIHYYTGKGTLEGQLFFSLTTVEQGEQLDHSLS